MTEYIEREQAVTVFKTFYGKPLRIMLEALAEEHAADVRPVVRGKWSTVYDDFMKSNYDTCSCCGKEYFGANGFNFCPNCGADMREEGVSHG